MIKKIAGGNSYVYILKFFRIGLVIKHYKKKNNGLYSLRNEFNSLKLLQKNKIKCFPKAFFKIEFLKLGLFSYIDGTKPDLNYETIDEIIEVLKKLKTVSLNNFRPAKDSIKNVIDLINQTSEIYANLISSNIKKEFIDSINYMTNLMRNFKNKIKNPRDLNQIVLIISDLGTHNMIKNNNDIMYFIDLEYFGFDTPNKLIGDTLNHPKLEWTSALAKYFFKNCCNIYDIELKEFINIFQASIFKWHAIVLRRILFSDYKENLVNELLKLENKAKIIYDFDLDENSLDYLFDKLYAK